MKKVLFFCLLVLLFSTNIDAKKQTYRQPVHLDDSGKPMINSWQKNEEQRQLKKQEVTAQPATQSCPILENGQLDPHCKIEGVVIQKSVTPVSIDSTVGSTPTSVLVNRPVQVNVKTTNQDNP